MIPRFRSAARTALETTPTSRHPIDARISPKRADDFLGFPIMTRIPKKAAGSLQQGAVAHRFPFP